MGDRSDPPAHEGILPAGIGRAIAGFPADRISRPTRRRAGVFQRALRREVSRLHEPRRLVAMAILIAVAGVVGAGLIARGELAGADARAYWAGVRIWLNGGNPYAPTGPFLPYVYAPWMLPLFAPVGAPAVGRRLVRLARRGDPPPVLDDPLGLHAQAPRDRDRDPPAGVPDRGQPRHRATSP